MKTTNTMLLAVLVALATLAGCSGEEVDAPSTAPVVAVADDQASPQMVNNDMVNNDMVNNDAKPADPPSPDCRKAGKDQQE